MKLSQIFLVFVVAWSFALLALAAGVPTWAAIVLTLIVSGGGFRLKLAFTKRRETLDHGALVFPRPQ